MPYIKLAGLELDAQTMKKARLSSGTQPRKGQFSRESRAFLVAESYRQACIDQPPVPWFMPIEPADMLPQDWAAGPK